jgi:phage gp16-like protein
MSKTAKKRPSASSATRALAARLPTPSDADAQTSDRGSKQARIIAMLQSPSGTTIAAMIKATGWQQHSVRGFLAGVVRKRLKLKLRSEKVDGNRVYRIAGGDGCGFR